MPSGSAEQLLDGGQPAGGDQEIQGHRRLALQAYTFVCTRPLGCGKNYPRHRACRYLLPRPGLVC